MIACKLMVSIKTEAEIDWIVILLHLFAAHAPYDNECNHPMEYCQYNNFRWKQCTFSSLGFKMRMDAQENIRGYIETAWARIGGRGGMGQQFNHDCCNVHSCHNQPQLSQQQQPQLLLLQPQTSQFSWEKRSDHNGIYLINLIIMFHLTFTMLTSLLTTARFLLVLNCYDCGATW